MVTYGFFNSVEGDRKYDADQMSEYFEGLIGNGVYASVGNALAVEPDEGMNVRVLSGRGVINCKWLSNDAAVSLPITGSDPSYDRYTAVVMRLDVDNRLMKLDTIDGTPAAEPVKPTLTQSELIYELCLAWVRVNAGDVSVEEANITDARPTEDCGWVTGLITQQDVSDLTSDIYDELHTYAAGDYCIKDNTLQKNIVPTNPPEVWDPTHWEATNVGDELTEIKSNLTGNLTFTPASGVTVNYVALGAFNGVAYGSIECQLTATANAWVTLGTFNINPPQAITVPVVRTGDGTYCGMVNISSNNNVRLYSKQALSNNAIAFTFVFAYNPT